jgi:hypothetical protein
LGNVSWRTKLPLEGVGLVPVFQPGEPLVLDLCDPSECTDILRIFVDGGDDVVKPAAEQFNRRVMTSCRPVNRSSRSSIVIVAFSYGKSNRRGRSRWLTDGARQQQ